LPPVQGPNGNRTGRGSDADATPRRDQVTRQKAATIKPALRQTFPYRRAPNIISEFVMSNSTLLNPKHWYDRAEKTRAKADEIMRDDLKKKLLRVAEEYDRLAQRAQEQMRRTHPPMQR
jgi:molecular chaperone GrpE (heat shock protein)